MRRRLVVIGNGMAGARAVEEILARGGADQFTITMFGDEPYGNYNRIMLSNVLAGVEEESEIFLNDLAWYAANGIDSARRRPDRPHRQVREAGVRRRRHRHAVRQADHRHRQPRRSSRRSPGSAGPAAASTRASSRSARSTTPAP